MQQTLTQLDYRRAVYTLEQAKRDIETDGLELSYQCRLARRRIKQCKQYNRLAKKTSLELSEVQD